MGTASITSSLRGSDEEEGEGTTTREQSNKDDDNDSLCVTHTQRTKHRPSANIWWLVAVVIVLGVAASVVIVIWGSNSAQSDQDERFERQAVATVKAVQNAWVSYEAANLWIHEACRSTADQVKLLAGRIPSCTRQDFHELYLHMRAVFKVRFVSIGWATVVFESERTALEEESRAYFAQKYPYFDYPGFVGLKDETENQMINENIPSENILKYYITPRSRPQPYYVPVHYLEPLDGNEWGVDFDMASVIRHPERAADDAAYRNHWKPMVTERIIMPTHNSSAEGYSVFYFHPGIPLPDHPTPPTLDAACMTVYIPDVLRAAAVGQADKTFTFLYDNVDYRYDDPAFLAGALIDPAPTEAEPQLTFQSEISLQTLQSTYDCYVEEVTIVFRPWTVAVCQVPGMYEADRTYIWLGAAFLFLATLGVSMWFLHTHRRARLMNEMQARAAQEKACLLVESAKQAAKAERDLNEYIAHEIRNPLSSALSACSFVNSAVQNHDAALRSKDDWSTLQEDVHTISSSLHFANDLLRSMIDMHKVDTDKLKLKMTRTSVLYDVLEPVHTLLHSRDNPFEIQVQCDPEDLDIETDVIRLKQIMVNLASNSRKFVQKGYIRLGARVMKDNAVQLYVQDSGPGIPLSKRNNLFQKYQESLDVLSQGTGMGLCLCKNLSELLGGKLELDGSYQSDLADCPGAAFVLNLSCSPLVIDDKAEIPKKIHGINQCSVNTFKTFAGSSSSSIQHSGAALSIGSQETEDKVMNDSSVSQVQELSKPPSAEVEQAVFQPPENLKVLFVDDDSVLRRLMVRTFQRVAPTWELHQAANGETAIRMVDDADYDVIFLDQYMASTEKQLLGTETARELRAKGVTARICGLSANQMEESFLQAGANAFMQKPIPCRKDQILKELERVFLAE